MAKQKFNFQLTNPAAQPVAVSGEQGTNAGTVASIVQRLDNNDKNPFEIKLVPRSRIRMNKKNRDRKSTRLNSSHQPQSRMPSSA